MLIRLRSDSSSRELRPVSCRACDMFELCELAEQLRRVPGVRRAMLRTLRRNERLANTSDSFFFAVRKGLLKALRTDASGRKRVSHVYVPGDLIPANALSAGPAAIEVVAASDAMVCELDRESIAAMCRIEPACDETVQWLLQRNPAPRKRDDHRCAARLDRFLKRISTRLRARGLDEIDVLSQLTQAEIADLLQVSKGALRRATKCV